MKLTQRYHDPEQIHEDVVPPEVKRLGPRVRDAVPMVVERVSRVVEDVAVELAEGDDGLEGVA